MTRTDARPRTPSVSELQAALVAARQGAFAAGSATAPVAGPVGAPEQKHVPASPPDAPSSDTSTTVAPRPPAQQRIERPARSTPADGVTGTGTWLLGVHGGSGAGCLASVLSGTRSSHHAWPTKHGHRDPVVLVCRSSQHGLSAAQEFARQFRDGQLREHLTLLGVIVSADAPGRLPLPLRRLLRLLSGALPILGEIPWQPAWRLGPAQPFAEAPSWLTKLQQALDAGRPR